MYTVPSSAYPRRSALAFFEGCHGAIRYCDAKSGEDRCSKAARRNTCSFFNSVTEASSSLKNAVGLGQICIY